MSPHTQQVPKVKNNPWTECLSAQVLENQPEYFLLTTEVTQELLFISETWVTIHVPLIIPLKFLNMMYVILCICHLPLPVPCVFALSGD